MITTDSLRIQHSSEHLDTLQDLNSSVANGCCGSGYVVDEQNSADPARPRNRLERQSQQGNPLQQVRLG